MLVSTLCVRMNVVVMCAAGATSQTLAVQHLPRAFATRCQCSLQRQMPSLLAAGARLTTTFRQLTDRGQLLFVASLRSKAGE